MISVEEVRKRMRITHAYMDDDIRSNMEAARLDMGRVGIDAGKDDALVDKAVELYCKLNDQEHYPWEKVQGDSCIWCGCE